MSGDVVEGFRLKPVRRFETTSDPLAEASLCKDGRSAIQDNCFYWWLPRRGLDTQRLLKQRRTGAGLNRLDY